MTRISKKKAEQRLDLVVDGVNKGGETFIWWESADVLKVDGGDKRFNRFTRNFNNWAHAHMGRALVAYYRASGKPEVLKALTKVYADFPLADMNSKEFLPHGGATNLDPMMDAYTFSGDKRILKNAVSFAESTTFTRLAKTWATGKLRDGHTVLYYEHARVPAITAVWTGNEQALKASTRVLELGLKQHGLPVGLASGQEHLMGTGAIRGLETCTVAASSWTNKWMLQITGEAQYADQMEKAILNAGPASLSRDFNEACYFQTVNYIDSVVPIHTIKNIAGYDFSETAGKTLCCVANTNRFIPDYVQHMWMATIDRGLAATLYGPGTVKGAVGNGKEITIRSNTNYPFNSKIEMTVSGKTPVAFPLYLRVPEWCESINVTINSKASDTARDSDGFVKLERTWTDGDTIKIDLPIKVKIERSHTTAVPNTYYFKKEVRATAITKVKNDGMPYASVHYGPLLFALPLPDDDAQTGIPAKWNYALGATTETLSVKDVDVVHEAMPKDFHWQLDSPLKLQVPASEFNWKPDNENPLPWKPVDPTDSAKIVLVPYGTTKNRVAMFPVHN